MKQFWSIWEGHLDDEQINYIIEMCEKFPTEEGKIFSPNPSDRDESPVLEKEVRTSEIRFVDDEHCSNLIWQYVQRANATHYGFDIEDGFPIQYTTYKGSDKGHYHWHQDTDMITDNYEDRKLSVVIQLSDPEKYKGGDFEFEINGETVNLPGFRKKGSILVFPSFLRHRVKNVTKGKRNSLVSWISGPNFK
tara:strand:- start:3303 stop:3878 length:576 start_codon:yes stop_codon:yes gene_type:complete